MRLIRYFVGTLGVAVVISLLLSVMVVPTALASSPFDVFDMNDRVAAEKGGSGFGKVRLEQEDSIEIKVVRAENLIPNHAYEVSVTVQPPGPLDPDSFVAVISSEPITADDHGRLKIKDFDLGEFDPGQYRLDIFVTHTHPTVPDPILGDKLDRDLLLACQPAPVVTVVDDDDDHGDDEDGDEDGDDED